MAARAACPEEVPRSSVTRMTVSVTVVVTSLIWANIIRKLAATRLIASPRTETSSLPRTSTLTVKSPAESCSAFLEYATAGPTTIRLTRK